MAARFDSPVSSGEPVATGLLALGMPIAPLLGTPNNGAAMDPRARTPILLACLVFIVSCADECAASARWDEIRSGTERAIYEVPLNDLQTGLATYFHDVGADVDPGAFEPGTTVDIDTGHFDRTYQVRINQAGRRYSVMIHSVSREAGEGSGAHRWRDREAQMEWEIYQRVDPEAAHALMQRADERAARAFANARRWGCQ